MLEGVLLRPTEKRAGGILDDDGVVFQKVGIAKRMKHANVSVRTNGNEMGYPQLAQGKVEISAKETAVAALGDDKVPLSGACLDRKSTV